jgi:hypothetical protein
VGFEHFAMIEPALPLIEAVPECGVFALDPYRACDLRCVYCITGAQGASMPRYSGDELIPQLHRELEAVPLDTTITVGSLSDGYPLVEAELGVTRRLVAELVALGRPFGVITKGATVLRDIDLFLAGSAAVTVSLCSVDDELLRTVDPRAPGVEERLAMVTTLRAAGVEVRVSASPWIPGITDAAALIDRVGPGIRIRFAPLNVLSPMVARTPFGKRYDQREVNDAYLRDFQRVGASEDVIWQIPVELTAGAPVHNPFTTISPPVRAGAAG